MSNYVKHLVRQNVKDLIPYSSARSEFKGRADVLLDANENPWGDYNRYPDPFQIKLKEKLAAVKGVRPGQVFFGNGSDSICDATIRVFCDPGKDKVIIFPPTFGMYQVAAGINNVDLIKIPLDEHFLIDREQLEPYLHDPSVKLIFLCSPNNPTANLMRDEDVLYILDNFKGITVIDEAYIDFNDRETCLLRLDKYPGLVVLQTLSKAWGLAGARMGIAYASEEIIGYYNKVKTPYNISSLDQQEAMQTLLDEKGDFKKHLDLILKEKTRLIAGFKEIKVIKKVYPSDSNFFFVEMNDGPKAYQQLVDQGIIVRSQERVKQNFLRISVGKPEDNDRLLKALKEMK